MVYIRKTVQGLHFRSFLETSIGENPQLVKIPPYKKLFLPVRIRCDESILEVNLPQEDEEGRAFSMQPVWNDFLHSKEMTMRWFNQDGKAVIRHGETNNLDHRVAQAYIAWYLMNMKSASLT